MIGSPPPAFIFFAGALVYYLLPRVARKPWVLLVPVISGATLLATHQGVLPEGSWSFDFLGQTLELFQIQALAVPFVVVFHIAAFLAGLFALRVEDDIQHSSALVYAGSALGAVCAGDLLSVFLFWEVMAVSSVFLVWARRTERARRAGLRYLVFQLVSGLVFLAGVLLHLHAGGSLAVTSLVSPEEAIPGYGRWLILVALGIKAGFPLAHTWIVDAYPEATPTGTVWLSAFTTKTAVYLLAACFAGTEALIVVGAVMAIFPIFYAVVENDLRRVLAYSMVNQIGFMVVGIGIGTPLAVNGAVAHAFADVLFKGLLFMSMGAVLQQTGRIGGAALGGLYKSMPLTCLFCIVGACSISAFPLFSAFATKSMIVEAAHHGHLVWLWLLLLFASAGVLEHAGIKIPYFAFFAHDSGLRPKEPPRNMLLAMAMAAALCVLIGCRPGLLYGILPHPMEYAPYTASHVVEQMQILLFATLAVAVLIRTGLYPPEIPSVNLDVDWIYRKGWRLFLRFVRGPIAGSFAAVSDAVEWRLGPRVRKLITPPQPRQPKTPTGVLRPTKKLGYLPKETIHRERYERMPIGIAVAVCSIVFVVILSLVLLL